MCFSAEASFVGAAVVGACGVATLTLVRRPRELVFASLPLAFGIHQLLEGITWVQVGTSAGAELTGWGVHLWVLFAWALLPTWVPLGVVLIEPEERRRRPMWPLLSVGVVLSLVMLSQAAAPGIDVVVTTGSLDYRLPSAPGLLVGVPYVLATCLTPALSSQRWIRVFGVANFVALSAAALIDSAGFSSLWCTFAAFLSLIVLAHYLGEARRDGVPRGVLPAIDPDQPASV